jgi:hypothetical protein
MIALASNVRVWLACGHTDMRRYAESPVMRSPAPEASIALAYQAIPLRIITIFPRCAPHRGGHSCRYPPTRFGTLIPALSGRW